MFNEQEKQCLCGRTTPQPRRSFIGILCGVAGVLLWPSLARAKKVAVKLDVVPKLKKVGGWAIVKIKGKELLMIRDTEKSVRALSPLCTHKRHRLHYLHRDGLIHCSNHGSRFSLEGKVLKGPANRALSPVYWTRLELDRQRIVIKLD